MSSNPTNGTVHFDGDLAFAHLRRLAVDFAGRLGGSPQEHAAADYIAGYLESLGLTVRRQPFPVRNYERAEVRLEIVEPALGEIPCENFYLTQDTPPEGVTGELLFVESGALQYIGPEWTGKIVVIPGGLRGEGNDLAMRFKPLAIVDVETQVGVLPVRNDQLPEVRAKVGAVPEVLIAHEDGLRLLRAGARVAHIVARAVEHEAKSQNVIAELPGRTFPEDIIALTAHYDSSLGIQGASDNAGGTAVLLELARVLAAAGSARTLRFIAFGSEELGLRGSVAYVRALKEQDKAAKSQSGHPAAPAPTPAGPLGDRIAEGYVAGRDRTELERHRLCVNVDVQGALIGANEAYVLGPGDLSAAVRLLAAEEGPVFEVKEECGSTDSAPFSEAGVPSVSFVREGGTTAYLHSERDVIDYLGPGPLALQGRYIERFIRRWVSESRALPFAREIPEAQAKQVHEYFEKRLRIGFVEKKEG